MDFDCVLFAIGVVVLFRALFLLYPLLVSYLRRPVDLKREFHTSWALIVGANSGLGRNLAHIFAAQGINVIGTGRDLPRLQAVQAECAAKGAEFIPVVADLFDPKAVRTIVDSCGDRDVGIVMINAGLGDFGPVAERSDEFVVNFFQLLGTSYAMLAREFLIRNHDRQHKSVIYFTASVAGKLWAPTGALYFPIKSYVSRFVEHLVFEAAGTNIAITAMHPGFFLGESQFVRFMPPKMKALTGNMAFIAGSRDVANGVIRTLGRYNSVQYGSDTLFCLTAEWAVGELPFYFIGRALTWIIRRVRRKFY
jgi:short-subunit dehydrogenase